MELASVGVGTNESQQYCSKSQRNMSLSTAACTASIATSLPTISAVCREKTCLKIPTQALSLKQAYGNDMDTTFPNHVPKHEVAWTTIEIHIHGVMLGDHPSVSSGPPITIEWDAFKSVKLTIVEYEESKPSHRSSGALLIPKAVREDWLRNQGYSRRELEMAIRSIHENKKGRLSSAADGRGWSKLFTRNKNVHGQRQRRILR
jgi:hypothetical protein